MEGRDSPADSDMTFCSVRILAVALRRRLNEGSISKLGCLYFWDLGSVIFSVGLFSAFPRNEQHLAGTTSQRPLAESVECLFDDQPFASAKLGQACGGVEPDAVLTV